MPSPPSGAPSLLYSVKRLELAVRARIDSMLRGSAISRPQYTALTALRNREGISAAELARDSFVSPQAISEIVNRLERLGLVRRDPHPDDRRQTLLQLTPEGIELLDQFDHRIRQIEDQMTSNLDPEDARRIAPAVRRMWESLR